MYDGWVPIPKCCMWIILVHYHIVESTFLNVYQRNTLKSVSFHWLACSLIPWNNNCTSMVNYLLTSDSQFTCTIGWSRSVVKRCFDSNRHLEVFPLIFLDLWDFLLFSIAHAVVIELFFSIATGGRYLPIGDEGCTHLVVEENEVEEIPFIPHKHLFVVKREVCCSDCDV